MALSTQAATAQFSFDCFSLLSPPLSARSLAPQRHRIVCTTPNISLSMEPPPENAQLSPSDPEASPSGHKHSESSNFDDDCGEKKYKIWVMEAQLPWDKSQDIMCNGNNPWPAGGGRDRRRSMIKLSRRVVDVGRPATVPDEAAYIRGSAEEDASHNKQGQSLWDSDRVKDEVLESFREGEDQGQKLPCVNPMAPSRNTFRQEAGRNEEVEGSVKKPSSSKRIADKMSSRNARTSKTGERSASPSKMAGKSGSTRILGKTEHEERDLINAEQDEKKKKKKPSSVPYKDMSQESYNPWIIDWDESKAVGFSPWGDNNEAKGEIGHELCSYMKKVARNSPLSSMKQTDLGLGDPEKTEPKRGKPAKKRHKGKRSSARSRRGKSDNSKSTHRARRTSSIKSNRSEQSSIKDREEQSYCPGEYEACAGVGEYEGEDPFDEMESVNMNEASHGWGTDEDLRPTPQIPPKPNDDIADVSSASVEQTVDCRANHTSNTSIPVPEVVSVPGNEHHKQVEYPLDCSEHKDGVREVDEPEKKEPFCSGEWEPTDIGSCVGDSGNDGADRAASCGRAQVPASRMSWNELFSPDLRDGSKLTEGGGRQEPGLIRKLTGSADSSVKKRFSARSVSRRTKRPSWDGSVSDRPFSRPSSNPCVSTFEPLGMIPKEAQGALHRSRALLRGRPRSQPTGDIHPPIVPSSIPACHTEAHTATNDDDIGRVQMAPKRSTMVQCRKIELPLKREEDDGAAEEIHLRHHHTHMGQGVLTFAPFFGSKVSRGSLGGSESSRRSSCCGNGSPRATHPGLGDGDGKERIGKDARSWSFNLEDLGPEMGGKKIALFPRHGARGCGVQTKGIGDCIDLLWKGIPRDSAAGFSRSGHEVVCKTIGDILGDDRFLDPEETWSKFALRKDSKQKSSIAMSGVMQAMGLGGVKGMFLHLARVVYRAGLAVDWGVLHDDLLSRLGKVVPRNTLPKSKTESSSTPARNTRSDGSCASSPPPVHERGTGSKSRKPWEGPIPDTVKRSRKLHISPDMLLQARADDRFQDFSGSLNQHRSFIVLLPLSASRLDDVRWKQRTRGGRGSSPALPHTPLRQIRRTKTL